LRKTLAFVGALIVLAGFLNATGFCFHQLRYLTKEEFVDIALTSTGPRIADFPSDVENPARSYLMSHPHCCFVTPSGAWGNSLFENAIGWRTTVVRIAFPMKLEQIEQAPNEGAFYELFLMMDSCGDALDFTGQRLKQMPE